MDRTAVIWVGVAVLALVFVDLLFVELRRMAREGKRIAVRLAGYADLPIVSLAAAGMHDIERIVAAADAVAPLIARAQAAIAVIRNPPLFGRKPQTADYLPKGSSPG